MWLPLAVSVQGQCSTLRLLSGDLRWPRTANFESVAQFAAVAGCPKRAAKTSEALYSGRAPCHGLKAAPIDERRPVQMDRHDNESPRGAAPGGPHRLGNAVARWVFEEWF